MAYIGRGLDKLSNVDVLDAITFTNSAGPYNITKSSTAFIPSAIQNLLIEVDGVIQASASYTISGSTITFGVSMSSSLTMNSFLHFGMGVSMTPTDGSVSTAKIVDDAVTTSKILDNNVTVAKLPTTLNISGNTVTLPASVSGLGTGITNAQLAGSITDAKITGLASSKLSGLVPVANLGTGTASASTYLAGDQTYKEVVAIDIAWQSVVTGATLTAVAGRGYPINTTSNACTVTLPASASVGDQIIFTDYLRTWGTNAVTINPNSLKFQGNTTPQPVYDTNGESIHIVYMDVTQGWVPLYDGAVALETPQTIDFLVIAGGGSGGTGTNSAYREGAGGGGAGGYRTSTQDYGSAGVVITVTVGDGGAAQASSNSNGSVGSASSISGTGFTTFSSAGGGYGARDLDAGGAGGSGGGGGAGNTGGAGGAGNTPSTDPVQGYAGGSRTGLAGAAGGGGGGASEVGENGGIGGDGLSSSITGAAVTRAGGGGSTNVQAGGSGGGGTGGGHTSGAGGAGTVNTGSGGGGTGYGASSGAGGKGVVILSFPSGLYSGTTTGSPTVGDNGSLKVLTFTGTGSYTT